jgi:hypothetical protein
VVFQTLVLKLLLIHQPNLRFASYAEQMAAREPRERALHRKFSKEHRALLASLAVAAHLSAVLALDCWLVEPSQAIAKESDERTMNVTMACTCAGLPHCYCYRVCFQERLIQR